MLYSYFYPGLGVSFARRLKVSKRVFKVSLRWLAVRLWSWFACRVWLSATVFDLVRPSSDPNYFCWFPTFSLVLVLFCTDMLIPRCKRLIAPRSQLHCLSIFLFKSPLFDEKILRNSYFSFLLINSSAGVI